MEGEAAGTKRETPTPAQGHGVKADAAGTDERLQEVREYFRNEHDPNHPFHRIAARLRFGINVKGRVWAARGARERWAAREKFVVIVDFALLLDLEDCFDSSAAPLKAR